MRTRSALLAALFLVACGDDGSDANGPDRYGDSGPGRQDTSSDVAPSDTEDDTEADAGADTSVPDVAVDTTTPDAGDDAQPVEIPNECLDVVYVADEAYRAADIIWVIDTSESMDTEIGIIRNNINDFVSRIDGSGVDTRVVMVASKEDRTIQIEVPMIPFPVPQSYLGVCVPPPLSAAAGCPDTDNPPTFMHPDVDVYSNDAMERLMVDAYPQFRLNLRPHARTHIVFVTDDSSSKNAQWFRDQTRTVDPPGFSLDYVVHSIIARGGDSCGDGVGDTYQQLSLETGGVVHSVCLSDWTPIFEGLLEGVVNDAQIPCAFGMPEPEEGLVIRPDQVNVLYTPPSGEQELVRNVDTREDCPATGGWYYDNPGDPTAVYICPGLCGDGVQGTIDIAFGCDTIKE